MLVADVKYPFPGRYGISPGAKEPAPILCRGVIECLTIFFSILFKILTILAGVFAVIIITWAGILFIVKGADEKKRIEAKNMLIWAAIGLIVALISYSLVILIENFAIKGVSYNINYAYGEDLKEIIVSKCPQNAIKILKKSYRDGGAWYQCQIKTSNVDPEVIEGSIRKDLDDYYNTECQDYKDGYERAKCAADIYIQKEFENAVVDHITLLGKNGEYTGSIFYKYTSKQNQAGQPIYGQTKSMQTTQSSLSKFQPKPIGCTKYTVLDLIEGKDIPAGLLTTCILWFTYKFFRLFYVLSMLTAITMLVYAGFKYITSGGGESGKKVHNLIIYVIIGIIVTILSYSIVKALEYTLTK